MDLSKSTIEMIRKHLERRLSFPIDHIELLDRNSNNLLVRNSIKVGYGIINFYDFNKVETSTDYSDTIKRIVDDISVEYMKDEAAKSESEREFDEVARKCKEIEARQIHIIDYPTRIREEEPTEEQQKSIVRFGEKLHSMLAEYKAKVPEPVKTKDEELIDKLMSDLTRDTYHDMTKFSFEIKDTQFFVKYSKTGLTKQFRFRLGSSTMQYRTIALKIKGYLKDLESSRESDEELIIRAMRVLREDLSSNLSSYKLSLMSPKAMRVTNTQSDITKTLRFGTFAGLIRLAKLAITDIEKEMFRSSRRASVVDTMSDDKLIHSLFESLKQDGFDVQDYNLFINSGNKLLLQNMITGGRRIFKFRIGDSPTSSTMSYEGIYSRVKTRVTQLNRIQETRRRRDEDSSNEDLIKKLKRQLREDTGKFLSQYVISMNHNFLRIENTRTGGIESIIYRLSASHSPMDYDRMYESIKLRFEKLEREETQAKSVEKIMANSVFGSGLKAGELAHIHAPVSMGKSSWMHSYAEMHELMRKEAMNSMMIPSSFEGVATPYTVSYDWSGKDANYTSKKKDEIISEVKEIEI